MRTKLIAIAAACLAGGSLLFGGVAGHRLLAGLAARGVIRPMARALGVADDPASRDARLIQGTWQGVEMVQSGTRAPAREARDNVLVFEGEDLVLRSLNGPMDPVGRARFKLDPDKTPAAIDITPLDGPERGRILPGIYQIEKNRLTIHLRPGQPGKAPGPRPSEFQTRDGDGVHVLVLERVGPGGPVDPGPSDPTLATYEVIRRDYDRAMGRPLSEAIKVGGHASNRSRNISPRASSSWPRRGPVPARNSSRCAGPWSTRRRASRARRPSPSSRAAVSRMPIRSICGRPWKRRRAGHSCLRPPESPSLRRSPRSCSSGPNGSSMTPAAAGAPDLGLPELLASVRPPRKPRMFTRAADLIAARFPDSPKIADFCDDLGNLQGGNAALGPQATSAISARSSTAIAIDGSVARRCSPWPRSWTACRPGPTGRGGEALRIRHQAIPATCPIPGPRTWQSWMTRQAARSELKKIRDRKRRRAASQPDAAR